MPDDLEIVLVTVPDAATGTRLARALVEERLAACVNRVPGLTSVYRFESSVHEDREELLVIKTTAARLEGLERRVVELHPYEVPEFVVVSIDHAAPAYAAWLRAQ